MEPAPLPLASKRLVALVVVVRDCMDRSGQVSADLCNVLKAALAKRGDFIRAREAMNAARPDVVHATAAERALYAERYRADNEAERAYRIATLELFENGHIERILAALTPITSGGGDVAVTEWARQTQTDAAEGRFDLRDLGKAMNGKWDQDFPAAVLAALTAKPSTEGDDLNKRLCDLHARLAACFQGATGQAPPRRPRFFEPKWEDMDTVLDAAVALDHATAKPNSEALVEALTIAVAGLGRVNVRCFDRDTSPLKPIGDIARDTLAAVSSTLGDDAYDKIADAALAEQGERRGQ